MRKLSKKSQQLNSFITENPDAKAAVIAKKFKVSIANVYQRKSNLKTAAGKSNWKLTSVSTSNKSVFKHQKPSTLAPNAVMSMSLHAEDKVNHPSHYKVGGIETIDFIEAKQLDYHLGNVVKYISRAEHKDEKLVNLKKAQWYLNRAVSNLEKTK
jgi:hypothetical protein